MLTGPCALGVSLTEGHIRRRNCSLCTGCRVPAQDHLAQPRRRCCGSGLRRHSTHSRTTTYKFSKSSVFFPIHYPISLLPPHRLSASVHGRNHQSGVLDIPAAAATWRSAEQLVPALPPGSMDFAQLFCHLCDYKRQMLHCFRA
jgi:hypothetical protein